MDRVETAFRLAFKVAPFVCYDGNAALNLHYSWAFHALKGHGFSRAVSSVLLVALATEGLRCWDEVRVSSGAEAQLSTLLRRGWGRALSKLAVFAHRSR